LNDRQEGHIEVPAPSPEAVALHHRSIDYRAYSVDDDLVVIGHLVDRRPWAQDSKAITTVHDLELRVRVRVADLVITGASAHMATFPHAECPSIEAAFAGLVGLSVSRGYTREVQARFGGPRGCTHLEHLARSLGPVVIQAVTSARAQSVDQGTASDLMGGTTDGSSSPWALGSCHIWAEDGVAPAKLAAGWRPGVGPYPAPALATFIDPPKSRG
jgi:hypothetical protein